MNPDHIGLHVPDILLPRPGTDLAKWAVVACDQYTSEPDYWQQVDRLVGNQPSTLRMILPEVYLDTEREAATIESINATMHRYLEQAVFAPPRRGFVLVDRATAHQPSRKGLIVALDLEHYDFHAGAGTLIRATEGTIMERLPPRVRVRKNAPLELPHIMVLIDDPQGTVIEPLFNAVGDPAYDFDLMMHSGHIRGWMIDDPAAIASVGTALTALAQPDRFAAHYHAAERPVLLYAMGDGNHSLATAKVIWEKIKQAGAADPAIMQHPARYALVELVNVHDPGLEFEPIHRVLFNVNRAQLLAAMQDYYQRHNSACRYTACASLDAARAQCRATGTGHAFAMVTAEEHAAVIVDQPAHTLQVATLQAFLDEFLASHQETRIDYVHGDAVVGSLGVKPGNAGFYLDAMSKHDLFPTIIFDGALPRKTFSMGESDEKRFYLECRAITA